MHSTGRSGAAGVIVEAAVLMPLPATEFLGLGETLVYDTYDELRGIEVSS